jgi:endonuclease/exonuclease/phosphatase family metal-dependent hydrolase
MNESTDAAGSAAIEHHAKANAIIAKAVYSDADKQELIDLSKIYKWHLKSPPQNALLQLKKIRGSIFYQPKIGPLQVAASGRADWVGWFELRREDIAWKATYNTGRVIATVKPDILITIEVEDRPTLQRFNSQVLKTSFDFWYPHFMLIDGNDMRGIDIGIYSRYPITEIRSHVDDPGAPGFPIFSRDCPEYDIVLPGGERLVIIPNHFKSKRNGDDAASQKKRTAQAERAHTICVSALKRSGYVLMGGDLNDTPTSTALVSLFNDGFKDISMHASYPTDRPGTFDTGTASNKIDYLIMSPKLQKKLKKTGIERGGSYHPGVWQPFDTVTGKTNEASDHHLIWADFNFGN